MIEAQTMSPSSCDEGFPLGDDARRASITAAMQATVVAGERGDAAKAINLPAGFWGEGVSVSVENGRVILRARDVDRRELRMGMPWTCAAAIGAALIAGGEAIRDLP